MSEAGRIPESSPEQIQEAAPVNAAEHVEGVKPEGSTESPPAESKDESLLDRVQAAIKPKTGDSSTPQVDQKPKDGEAPVEGEEPPTGDPTDEELSRYHSKTRKRITQLVTRAKEAEGKLTELTPDAEAFSRIKSFVSDAGINAEEFNLLLQVGKNLKNNPAEALKQITPYVNELLRLTGEVLPEDLKTQVEQGYLTEDHARELARARSTAGLSQAQLAQRDQRDAQQREQSQRAEHVTAVQTTISSWEAKESANDPDWNLKQDRIKDLIELAVRRDGFPKTTQAAIDIANKAKETATAEIRKFAPSRRAVTPLPNAASTQAKAKPATLIEAMAQAASG
jgi:hypothetical protein